VPDEEQPHGVWKLPQPAQVDAEPEDPDWLTHQLRGRVEAGPPAVTQRPPDPPTYVPPAGQPQYSPQPSSRPPSSRPPAPGSPPQSSPPRAYPLPPAYAPPPPSSPSAGYPQPGYAPPPYQAPPAGGPYSSDGGQYPSGAASLFAPQQPGAYPPQAPPPYAPAPGTPTGGTRAGGGIGGNRGIQVLGGVVLGVVLLVVGYLVLRPGHTTTATPGTASSLSTSATQNTGQPAGGGTPAGGTTPPTAQASTSDAEAAALQQLNDLRAGDRPQLTFNGQYVAQLSSKTVGTVDAFQLAQNGTHTFYAADILAEHLALRKGNNLGATIVLLLSTDYGKRQTVNGSPLWVTFAVGSFASPDDVTAWCAARFPTLSGKQLTNACAVRQLQPPTG